jgi:hypothetical protein
LPCHFVIFALLFFAGSGRRATRRRQSFSTSASDSDDDIVAAFQSNHRVSDLQADSNHSSSLPVQNASDDVSQTHLNINDSSKVGKGLFSAVSKPATATCQNVASNGFSHAFEHSVSVDAAQQAAVKAEITVPENRTPQSSSSGPWHHHDSVTVLQLVDDDQPVEAFVNVGRTDTLKSLKLDTNGALPSSVADGNVTAFHNRQSNSYYSVHNRSQNDQNGSAALLFLNASFKGNVSKQLSSQIAKLLMEMDAAKDLNIQVSVRVR